MLKFQNISSQLGRTWKRIYFPKWFSEVPRKTVKNFFTLSRWIWISKKRSMITKWKWTMVSNYNPIQHRKVWRIQNFKKFRRSLGPSKFLHTDSVIYFCEGYSLFSSVLLKWCWRRVDIKYERFNSNTAKWLV